MADIVRVLRLVEYVGPRLVMEGQIRKSIHGTVIRGSMVITATTIGEFPDLIDPDSSLALALQQVEALQGAHQADVEKWTARAADAEEEVERLNELIGQRNIELRNQKEELDRAFKHLDPGK